MTAFQRCRQDTLTLSEPGWLDMKTTDILVSSNHVSQVWEEVEDRQNVLKEREWRCRWKLWIRKWRREKRGTEKEIVTKWERDRDGDKVRGRDRKRERDCERIIWPSLSLSLINDLGREALRSPVHEHTCRFNSMPGVSASTPHSLFPAWLRAARTSPHIFPFSYLSLINVQQSHKCKTDCSTVYMCVFVGTPASGVMKSPLQLVQVVFGL